MLDDRMLGALAEDALVAAVCRRHLLVELLLVDSQRLVGDVEVGVRTAAAALLREDIQTVAVAKRNNMIELHNVLVRPDKRLRRPLADHVVAGVRLVVVRLVAQHLEHLERRRQRLGERLADGSLRNGSDAARHDAHVLVDLCADDERLARTARHDSVLVLGLQHEIRVLRAVDVNILLPVVLMWCCHVCIISSACASSIG